MKLFNSFALLISASFIVLSGCGQSVIGGGKGGDGGTSGDGGSDGGAGGSGGALCNGHLSAESCENTGCPSGYTCIPDEDPSTCHSSSCECDPAHGWGCTDDCSQNGSTCQPAPALCKGEPSPVGCTNIGCPDGYICVSDPDPNACHPSGCMCEPETGWTCTADCGQNGSICVKGT
ncbi:Multiple EGF-like-domain protein 3 precursor [Minicystis rosea]|nr:Multiple EGF-like-domain protein 3 precursor [Minicystis rosea]